ncbi:MAG: putative DNA modification/repair radical SAM protein [Promethearchaeota archaeon]
MPSLLEKIRVLGAAGKYDICASSGCASSGCASNSRVSDKPLRKTYIKEEEKNSYFGSTLSSGICHSFTPDGRCVSLFKVLFSNACIFNCKYCFNKVNRRKISLTPEEYARAFMHLYLGNYVEGMFLSSGITKNADVTMEKMLQAVILLREKHNFRGYIHFKCLPGASRDIIKRAAQYVDRMSINLESPTQNHLSEIADQKTLKTDILRRQEWIRDMSEKNFSDWEKVDRIQSFDTHNKISNQTCEVKYNQAKQLPAGQTTQFVVGAADETDWDILNRLNWEYKSIKLRRGYFSAFHPIIGTPLEKKPATPLLREHRLYQTDWLMRIYKIPLKEIKNILTDDLYLPRTDPKIKLAKNYFDGIKPNDINNLPYSELLRIPGIGLTSARRIMKLRNEGIKITKKIQLKNIGVVLKRAEPYIKFGNSYQSTLEVFIV